MRKLDIAIRILGLVAIVLCFAMANTELFRGVCLTTHRMDGIKEWREALRYNRTEIAALLRQHGAVEEPEVAVPKK